MEKIIFIFCWRIFLNEAHLSNLKPFFFCSVFLTVFAMLFNKALFLNKYLIIWSMTIRSNTCLYPTASRPLLNQLDLYKMYQCQTIFIFNNILFSLKATQPDSNKFYLSHTQSNLVYCCAEKKNVSPVNLMSLCWYILVNICF